MSAKVKFLVRREDNPKYLKYFEAAELCVMMAGMVLPPPIALILRIPLWVAPAATMIPLFLFIAFFRYNRPKSYFYHWLKFQLRCRVYRMDLRSDRYLLSLRNRIFVALQGVDVSRPGAHRRWHEVGLNVRWKSAPVPDPKENPFVRAVEEAQRQIRDRDRLAEISAQFSHTATDVA